MIKELFEKWTCKHKWKEYFRGEFIYSVRFIFECENCGKIKKVKL